MSNSKVVLVGAVHEAMPAFAALAHHPRADLTTVVTLDEGTASNLSGAVDLAGAAHDAGISVLRVRDVNDPDAVTCIRDSAPALLVVVGWTRLIRDDLLAVPTAGCIGFHASRLPHNRGRAPVNWAIIRGETSAGNTMMLLDAGVDTGGIVDQRCTPIYLNDTCGTVYDRVGQLGADMLTENLDALLDMRAAIRLQDHSQASQLPRRTPIMGITDWNRPPVDIHNWVRAQTTPYPGAYTFHEGRHVKLWATMPPLDHSPVEGTPGQIERIDHEGIRVSCANGSITVLSMSLEGEQPRSAPAFAARNGLRQGDIFTSPGPRMAAFALGMGPEPTSWQD